MANIDDLVTVQKNGVVAVNALTEALAAFKTVYENFVGTSTYLGAVDASLVSNTAGRLVNIMVAVDGSVHGTIHDAASVAAASSDNIIAIIPKAIGMVQINVPFFNGLVVNPGNGQSVSLTYS